MQLYAYIKVLAHLLALCIVLWIRTVSKEIELMNESFIILFSAKKKKWSHEFLFCLLIYIHALFFSFSSLISNMH